MIALYIILGIIGVAILVGIVYSRRYSANMDEAEKSGTAYKMLVELNNKYEFKKFRGDQNRKYSRSTNSQKYRDSNFAFSCFVKEVVLPDINVFIDFLKDVQYNQRLFHEYTQKFNCILMYARNSAEKNLCEQRKARPLIEASFTVELYYKYYNEYRSNKYKYEATDIQRAIDEAKKIDLNRTAAQRERAVMSDKLRIQILKRDNYPCQICGRSAKDGAELEVDHIIPISKGGKTVPNNLQTLCKRCNRGKRDNMM